MVVLLAGLMGCQTAPRPEESTGLPATAKLIGQGPGFVYGVPADGRIYIVRGEAVEKMQVVRKGTQFFSIGPVEGLAETKSFDDLRYYFEPVDLAEN